MSADAQPMATTNINNAGGLRRPKYASTAMASATNTAYDCRNISKRRRSKRSASAPPNNPNTSVGPRLAVWTSATMTAVLCFSTRNHCAAMLCIHVPMLETNCATNKLRYTRMCNGVRADGCPPSARSLPSLTVESIVDNPLRSASS